MKKLAVFLGLAFVSLFVGCLEPPQSSRTSDTGVIYRHHFIGFNHLGEGTNATKLKEVLERESTKKLGAEALKKLARAPRQYWTKHLSKNAADGAQFIEPLLADLSASESYIEARGSTARPECVIAVQVSDERAKLWDKNLKDLAAAWQLGKRSDVTAQGFKGWEIKRREYPNRLQFLRADKWVIASFGSDQLPLGSETLQSLAKSGAPAGPLGANALLELEADLPRIAPGIPALSNHKFPPTHLTILGRGEFVRTEAQFRYSRPLNWKFEPWRIPTNLIPEQIVSFTAAQGVAPLLNSIQGASDLGLKPVPNQVTTWGLGDAQGQIFAAFPVDNGTNAIQKLAPTLPKLVLKHFPGVMGTFLWASNRAEIIWQGLPYIVPYLQALNSAGQHYLFFGMFPRIRSSNAAPAELFAQLADRKDLAYYDWEITGQRTTHGRQMYQLAHIISNRHVPDPRSVSDLWLQDLTQILGPTVTEITVKSPSELDLVRKSHIGFTGFELATFSLWFESPGFPFKIEPRPLRPFIVTNGVPIRPGTKGGPKATNGSPVKAGTNAPAASPPKS